MLAALDRLDQYWADELGCTPDALRDGSLTITAPALRSGPRWMGWLVSLECIVLDDARAGGGVISVTPSLADELSTYCQQCREQLLPPEGRALFPFIRAHFLHGTPKIHRILRGVATSFHAAPEIYPISLLDAADRQASWYHLHFDGPVFVARDAQDRIAAWAAIKCKSADIWEMAVVTEARYRGMGLAKSVVSRATLAALDAGKVPLYLHEIDNQASARVCQALGYQPYGYELTCEGGRVTPHRKHL